MKETVNRFVRFVLFSFAAIAVVLCIGRGYELLLGIWNFGAGFFSGSYIFGALVRDLTAALIITIPLSVISLGAHIYKKYTAAEKIMGYMAAAVGVINILLITYFGATQIPLGAEFWAYSMADMFNTVMAADQISIAGVLGLIVAYWLFYRVSQLIIQLCDHATSYTRWVILGSSFFLVVLVGWFQMGLDSEILQKEKQANKLSYFIGQSLAGNNGFMLTPGKGYAKDYPLMKAADYQENVLGPFFEEFDSPPNIVFLLVESLGGEFVGPSGQWTGFAPYLDTLAEKSLHWENGISLSGRTFGMLPSLLGSLPFGRHGFMNLGPNYPAHQSLISILNKRGYYTAFYSGYDTYFDGMDFFLDYQQTDFVLNKDRFDNFLEESGRESNYWGVNDKTMLSIASGLRDTAQSFPRLEIYHTLQSHSPFNVPSPERYQKEFYQRLDKLSVSGEKREAFQLYEDELTTLLFADQAVEAFMKSYKRLKGYENTIFVITGDHWLIPVPQTTAISRYHVPIMIYSPKLKESVHFKSVNSHAEVVPTLMALLEQNTDVTMPRSVHWIGGKMDTARHFRNLQSVPLMRNKNKMADYLHENYYLYGNELYKLTEGLGLMPYKDEEVKNELVRKLNEFKALNDYVIKNERLYPSVSSVNDSKYPFLTDYDTLFTRLDSAALTIDEQFQLARQKAFDGHYEIAQAMCKRILLQSPDYHDVRLLLGRINAWQQNYDQAEDHFKEVLKRDSTYMDTYNAYFDNAFWQSDYKKALVIIEEGLGIYPRNTSLLERKIRVLSHLNKHEQAKMILDTLKKSAPNYENSSELEKYINE